MDPGTRSMLVARRFAPLFAAQFLGAFNDNLVKSAFGVLAAWRLAPGSPAEAGMLAMLAGAVFISPFLLFSGASGTLADRIDKARVARWTKLAEIPVVAGGVAGLALESVALLLASLFLLGLHSTVFGPVKYALLPQHLPPGELVRGNALVEAGTFLAILLGTVLGSALVLAPGGVAAIAGIGFAAALGGALAASRIPPAPPDPGQSTPRPRLLADTLGVLRLAAADGVQLGAILALSWFWAFGAAIVAGLPVLARGAGGDEAAVTAMLATFAIGIGAGSLLASRLSRDEDPLRLVVPAAVAMAAFAIDLWLLADGQWRLLADLLGLSVAGGAFSLPLYASLQRRGAPGERARVIAANNIANAAAMAGLAVLCAILLGRGWTMPMLVGACGVATLGVAASCAWLARDARAG
jgi:predicted MFS family arabinose efflux permease